MSNTNKIKGSPKMYSHKIELADGRAVRISAGRACPTQYEIPGGVDVKVSVDVQKTSDSLGILDGLVTIQPLALTGEMGVPNHFLPYKWMNHDLIQGLTVQIPNNPDFWAVLSAIVECAVNATPDELKI